MTALPSDPAPIRGTLRWIIAASVMLCMILEVLDMTIVNVALPHMMGALGAAPDQISWVLTSYMVSSAVVMPLSGYLATRFGRRKLLLVDVLAFISASAMCGLAQSLDQMVLFRILQGLTGATLMPLSQSVMLELFPGRERGKGMAIFAVGILLAPTLGPTIGGFLTEHFNWRWVFYINVPVGLLAFLMALRFMPDSPTERVRTDWIGLALLVIAVGCAQLVLDLGHSKHWLQSQELRIAFATVIVAGGAFILRSWNKPWAIVDLTLFRDRNFATSCLILFCMGLGLFGTTLLMPLLMQESLGYPAEMTGILLAPRAAAAAVFMPLVGAVLVPRFDLRLLILIGLTVSAASCFLMSGYSAQIGVWQLVVPGVLAGMGMSFLFIPLSTLAYETLDVGRSIGAAGLYNVLRVFGSSMGISVAATLLARQSSVHWAVLGGRLSATDPALQHFVGPGGSLTAPGTLATLHAMLQSQSSMLGFTDTFWVIGVSFLAVAPLLLFTRDPTRRARQASPAPAGAGLAEAGE